MPGQLDVEPHIFVTQYRIMITNDSSIVSSESGTSEKKTLFTPRGGLICFSMLFKAFSQTIVDFEM